MKKMIPTLSLEVVMYLCTNIYDSRGVLLLSKDKTIESERQLRRILEASNYYTFIDTEKGKDLEIGDFARSSKDLQLYSFTYETNALIEFAEEYENSKFIYFNAHQEIERLFDLLKNRKFPIQLERIRSLMEKFLGSIERSKNALFILSKTHPMGSYLLSRAINVAVIAMLLGEFLNFGREEIIGLGLAGLFHDVGNFLIPEEILNKPSRLTDKEWEVIKRHPVLSAEIIKNIPGFPEISLRAILEHHERVDGSGYPEGLVGESISKFARVLAIADVFDALTSKRPYNEGLTLHEGVSILFRMEELKSDFVEKFISLMGIYPIGTFVKLTTGELGLVISVNHDSLLRPKVGIIFDADRVKRKSLYEYIDLAESEKEVAIEKVLDPSLWEIDVAEYFENLIPEELFT